MRPNLAVNCDAGNQRGFPARASSAPITKTLGAPKNDAGAGGIRAAAATDLPEVEELLRSYMAEALNRR